MRRRLILLAVSTTAMVVIAFLFPLLLLVRTLAEDRALRPAELAAQGLAPVVALGDAATIEASVEAVRSRLQIDLAVALPDGSSFGSAAGPLPAAAPPGFRESALLGGGRRLVVPVVLEDGTAMVVADVPAEAITRGVGASSLALAALGVGLIAGSALVADRLGRRSTRAIADLEETAQRLSSGDLHARTAGTGPEELVRVGAALDTLAARIDELLALEREAAADLSHRLRTPLTALQLELEALPPGQQRDRLQGALDRLQATVTQIIAQARRPTRTAGPGHGDLAAVVRDRVEFWGALAQDEDRTLHLDLGVSAAMVSVTPQDLEELVDVLLGNVFTHTPVGTRSDVQVAQADDAFLLRIADDGPGLPGGVDVAARGVSGGSGSGLGLDIARRTASHAGGSLRLGPSPAGGVEVVVTLPAAGGPR